MYSYTQIHTCTNICKYNIYTWIYIHTRVYIYIHTYIRTHTKFFTLVSSVSLSHRTDWERKMGSRFVISNLPIALRLNRLSTRASSGDTYMYIYIYIYMHVCIYISMYLYTYIHIHTYIFTCICVYI